MAIGSATIGSDGDPERFETSGDILDDFAAEQRRKPSYPDVTVEIGMVVEDRASHYCGDIVRWNVEAVTLRERGGHLRHFGWKPGGFLIDGVPVTLVRPTAVGDGDPAGDRLRLGRRRRAGPRRAGEPDLGRGHPRRGADRARVG